MKTLVLSFFVFVFSFGSYAASNGGFGLSYGLGVPFITQVGVEYYKSNNFGFHLAYNALDVSVGSADVKLTMPEACMQYHPFSGAFFLGLGAGSEKLTVSATSLLTSSSKASIEVTAMTGIVKTGWMWGMGDGGFWFGMDVAYIIPFSAKSTITAPGVLTTSQTYIDALEAANKFGKKAYTNVTIARLGYLF